MDYYKKCSSLCVCVYVLCFLASVDSQNSLETNKVEDSAELISPSEIKTPLATLEGELECPGPEERRPFFTLECEATHECAVLGSKLLCCNYHCLKGVQRQKYVTSGANPSNTAENLAQVSIANSTEKQNISTLPIIDQRAAIPIPDQRNLFPANPTVTVPTLAANQDLICPGKDVRIPLFALPCRETINCGILGPGMLCCNSRCLKGVERPIPEPTHTRLFGVLERTCPSDPFPELLPVVECTDDYSCTPRICCPERSSKTRGSKSYCRTSVPKFDRMPVANRIVQPLMSIVPYLQCSPAPQLDLFPKPCESPLDCFPNLCCQEKGKRFCRPGKKSPISFIFSIAQRIGSSQIAKRFIQRIS